MVEEDGRLEILRIAEPVGLALELPDERVDTFGPGVGDAMVEVGADVVPMRPERARDALDRFESASHGPARHHCRNFLSATPG